MAWEGLVWWAWVVTALVIVASAWFATARFRDGRRLMRLGLRNFLQENLARLGDPYTISIGGKKFTVVNSPEAIKYILSTNEAAFTPSYNKQFKELGGEGKLMELPEHPLFRGALLATVTGEGLVHLLPFINSLAEKMVMSWEKKAPVIMQWEMQKYTYTVLMHFAWRDVEENPEELEEIRKDVLSVITAFSALPINFPGFAYHKAVKARGALLSRFLEAVSKRRESGSEVNDYLNALLKISKNVRISDYDLFCVMMSLLFAGHATSAALCTWLVKYLHDYPEVRQRVQDEQDRIRVKVVEDESLKWFKPKSSMPYTLQAVNEVLRLENFAPFAPRQAIKDVDYNGILFRKGSRIWANMSSAHFNPNYHPDPLKFNPSRFEAEMKRNTFMPFGQGPHLCPGSDLAITEALFMIHHLVTKFSWEPSGYEAKKSSTGPFRLPTGGYPIVVKQRVTSEAE